MEGVPRGRYAASLPPLRLELPGLYPPRDASGLRVNALVRSRLAAFDRSRREQQHRCRSSASYSKAGGEGCGGLGGGWLGAEWRWW